MTKPQKRGDRLNQSDRPHNNNLHNIPVPCSKENPCKICGASSHPCYWLPDESLCDVVENPPSGWKKIGVTRSKQTQYKLIESKSDSDPNLGSDKQQPNIVEFSALPVIDDEDKEILLIEIVDFVRSQRIFPNLQNAIPKALLDPFSLLAERLNIPKIVFVALLLPIASSLLPVGVNIEIDPVTQFYPPAILWVGLVAESGATKSPFLRILLSPLERIQTEENQHYANELQQYKKELKAWEQLDKDSRGEKPIPPTQLELYFQDATMEAIADVVFKQQKRGIIQAVDELAGWFNSLNQYRRGQGSDRQKWLSIYDGGAIKVNRKTSDLIYIPQTSISLVGTIQPCTLRQQMGNLDEVDGLWARFWWVVLPLTEMPPPGERGSCDIGELLYSTYRRLQSCCPTTYRLNCEGKTIWKNWHYWCEHQKIHEFHPALRAIYPKAKERAARIALVLHCLDAAIAGHPPAGFISDTLLDAAINLTRWGIEQAQLLYAEMGAASHEDSAKIARFILRFAGKEVTARNVSRWYPAKQQIKAGPAREFMKLVETLGFATGNGKIGSNYRIKVNCPILHDKVPTTSVVKEIDIPDKQPDPALTSPDKQALAHGSSYLNVSTSQESVSEFVRMAELPLDKNLSGFVSGNPIVDEDRDSQLPNNPEQVAALQDHQEIEDATLFVKVGDRVGKRLKQGWRGTVTAIESSHAQVHWQHDKYPELIAISDLEVVYP